jgi:hypothetical protein
MMKSPAPLNLVVLMILILMSAGCTHPPPGLRPCPSFEPVAIEILVSGDIAGLACVTTEGYLGKFVDIFTGQGVDVMDYQLHTQPSHDSPNITAVQYPGRYPVPDIGEDFDIRTKYSLSGRVFIFDVRYTPV